MLPTVECVLGLLCYMQHLFLNMNDNVYSCSIETLYVRNYSKVTDQFLKNSAIHCPYLKLLDIKGSGCTSAEIENFKANRPSTKVIY